MSDEASAYPDHLMNYANKSGPHNTHLESVGSDISRKLASFLQSNPDPKVMPQVRDIGKEVTAYATKKAGIDQWVFDVGLAFLTASEKAHPTGPNASPETNTDLGSRLSVTTDATLKKDLTDNALTRQAKSNADKLKKLLGDPPNLYTIHQNKAEIQKLLSWLQFYEDDPVQSAAFFNELGPENTLLLAHVIKTNGMGDDELTMLSKALAEASQSDTFDPDFAKNLADASHTGNSELGYSDLTQELGDLLRHGVYSTDFLTKLGDEYLFRNPQGGGGPLDMSWSDPVVEPFFNALARNPEAAYSYLTGPSPLPNMPNWTVMGHKGDPKGRSRLAQLMTYLRRQETGAPDDSWVKALDQSLLAADRQASDIGGPSNVRTLLHDLSDADLDMVADGYRPTIAQIVGEHIDVFVPNIDPKHPESPEIGSDWNWEERLFKGAVADGDGHVDADGIARIEAAIEQWSAQHVPSIDASSGSSMDAFRAFMYQVGLLWGLAALPARQGGYDAEHLKEEEEENFKTLIGLIPIKVPGLDKLGDEGLTKLAEYLSDHAIEMGEEWAAKGLYAPKGDADKEAVEIYYQQLARMRLMLAQQFVAKHPGLIKGMSRKQVEEYITQLADGSDPSGGKNPDVSAFETSLDSASWTFSQQYGNPGRG